MGRSVTFDEEKFSINVARLKKGGALFQIVVDPDLAVEYKEGNKDLEINNIVTSQKIFSEPLKGLLSSETEMQSIFGSSEFELVAKTILETGEIQLTTEYRKKLREAKRKKLLHLIHRNAVDPKTHNPIPMQRLELAFDEAKVAVEELKTAEDQVQNVVKKLQPLLPIRFEVVVTHIHLPANYAAKVRSTITKYGDIKKEDWQNDGSLELVVELAGGLKGEFSEELGSATHGCATVNFLENKK